MYDEKTDTYFSCCRTDMLRFVPVSDKNRILEIGAGSGETLLKAKESGLAGFVAGVELTAVANSNQSHPALDRFIIGNFETIELDFADNFFDVILCGDVLEHLLDPWSGLVKLRPLLREGGIIIASLPNVRYWKVSMGLVLCGHWNYCERGILDRTHLRFFSRKTIQDLFAVAGFTITAMESMGPQRTWGLASWAVNVLTRGLFSDLLTVQYLVVAVK